MESNRIGVENANLYCVALIMCIQLSKLNKRIHSFGCVHISACSLHNLTSYGTVKEHKLESLWYS